MSDVDTVLTSVSDETRIRQMPAGFLPRNALVASGCHFSEAICAICLATEIDHSSMVLFPDGARRVGHLRREGNISCQTHTLPSMICEHTRIQGYSCDVTYLQHFGMVGTCNIVGLKDKIFYLHGYCRKPSQFHGFLSRQSQPYFLGIVLICSVWD